MLHNPMNLWYTDLMTIERLVKDPAKTGIGEAFEEHDYTTIAENVPCRVYRNSNPYLKNTDTASEKLPKDLVACSNSVDVQTGDRLTITRGGRKVNNNAPDAAIQIYYAGDPSLYFEQFGGVSPKLDHQQIPIGTPRKVSPTTKDQ